MWNYPLEKNQPTRSHILKTDYPSLKSYQLSVAPKLGWGLMSLWGPISLKTLQAKRIAASCRQSRWLWVHTCSIVPCAEWTVLLVSSRTSFTPSWAVVLESKVIIYVLFVCLSSLSLEGKGPCRLFHHWIPETTEKDRCCLTSPDHHYSYWTFLFPRQSSVTGHSVGSQVQYSVGRTHTPSPPVWQAFFILITWLKL